MPRWVTLPPVVQVQAGECGAALVCRGGQHGTHGVEEPIGLEAINSTLVRTDRYCKNPLPSQLCMHHQKLLVVCSGG